MCIRDSRRAAPSLRLLHLPPCPPRDHRSPRAAGIRRWLPAISNGLSNRCRHRLPLVRRGGGGDARLRA
eukprot:3219968-Prymnesium_polylepis.1